MTTNSSISGEIGKETYSRRHSGLSALIQAATAQLAIDFDAAENDDHADEHRSEIRPGRLSESYTSTSSKAYRDHYQRFPEQLMALAVDPVNADVITFLPDGKYVALRAHEFADELMDQCCSGSNFDQFLKLANDWGFSCLSDRDSNIQVLRHPLFMFGNWEKCLQIRFGESPTNARVSALPSHVKLDFVVDKYPPIQGHPAGKRRLSPGFVARSDSESSSISQRLKTQLSDDPADADNGFRGNQDKNKDYEAVAPDEVGDLPLKESFTSNSRHDELRCIALAITTSELRLTSSGCSGTASNCSSPSQQRKSPLVDRAVESATHTIVTDAIETLLRDKQHTQTTYLKHEQELSRSSLPGVVPLSKQLFSSHFVPTTGSDASSQLRAPSPSSDRPVVDVDEAEQRIPVVSEEASNEW